MRKGGRNQTPQSRRSRWTTAHCSTESSLPEEPSAGHNCRPRPRRKDSASITTLHQTRSA
eukprot:14012343-Alexandrium_andersonii.AAC.1